VAIHTLEYDSIRHLRLNEGVFAQANFARDDELDFGGAVVGVSALQSETERYAALTQNTAQRQLAAVLFARTRQPRLMNHYFPIMQTLSPGGESDFHALAAKIAQNPNFDVKLIAEQRTERTPELPPDAVYLVAGHIVEIFFYRRDLLDEFLSQRRGFWLYTTPQAFMDDGGVAGGCYNPQRDAIQLVMSRLYEGFYAPTPGVAPFIHEFGHMLDHATGNHGLIPGMDTHIDLWRRGKQRELKRYEILRAGQTPDKLPIGHPYVFQNDGEFIAGYLEMFFRNPHYFAAQNEDLYRAFSLCLKQDPRTYWREDFAYYVRQNRDYYAKQRPPKPGLTIPRG
jgi:hypothetical protein